MSVLVLIFWVFAVIIVLMLYFYDKKSGLIIFLKDALWITQIHWRELFQNPWCWTRTRKSDIGAETHSWSKKSRFPFVSVMDYLSSSFLSTSVCRQIDTFLWLSCAWHVISALEHLRKKIELSTERIRIAKVKEDQARKVRSVVLVKLNVPTLMLYLVISPEKESLYG